jgi:hypothetical protein
MDNVQNCESYIHYVKLQTPEEDLRWEATTYNMTRDMLESTKVQ